MSSWGIWGSATALSLSIAGSALAADMPLKAPPPPPLIYSWTGCYVGLHAGGETKLQRSTAVTPNANFPAGFAYSDNHINGLVGGTQAGCNYQVAQWVFGVEGEYAWANGSGTAQDPSPLIAGHYNVSHDKEPWVATAAVRLGYAWDRFLFYVKGGAAWTRIDAFTTLYNPAGTALATTSGTDDRVGWLVGGGVEHAFSDFMTFKVEMDYMDYGTKNGDRLVLTGPSAGNINVRSLQLNEFIWKAGVNWKFGPYAPVVAKY